MSDAGRADFERAFRDLLVRFGADPSAELDAQVARAVAQMVDALAPGHVEAVDEGEGRGASLSPRDVVRVRANKFAATCVPASVYRERVRLARLRREIQLLAEAWLAGSTPSFFGG